jgi:hypothetical protein
MAGKSAILAVKILVDQKSAGKDLDKAGKSVGGFTKGLEKMAAPAAIAVGALAGLGKQALDAASEAEQAMGGVESVFGKSADKIKAWSDTSAEAVGLSKTQYGNLASLLGAQLRNLGVPIDKAADQTNDLIKLGADLAATFGGTTADAVSALGSALKGEADPAERYGLALNQTAVNAQLAAKGQDKLTGAALSQAKAQAIVEMATKQSAGAVGQFARESDTAAGSSAIASAQFANVTAELGEALLPVAVKVSGALSVVAKWMSENSTVVLILAGVVGTLAGAILLLNAYLKITAIVSRAAWLASIGPIGWVIAAVVAVIAIIVVLWNKCKWFRDAVTAVWDAIRTSALTAWRAIQTAVSAVVSAIVTMWRAFIGTISGVWAALSGAASAAWNAIKAPITAVIDWVVAVWRGLVETIRGVWAGLEAAARVAFDAIKGPIQAVIDWVVGVWEALVGVIRGVWDRIASAVTSAMAPIRSAIDAIANVWDATVGKISAGIDKVKGWLGGIGDKIAGVVGKVANLGKSTTGNFVVTPAGRSAAATTTSPALYTAAGPQRAGGAGAGAQAPVINITVNGAVDADGTARTIQRVMTGRARRVGPVQLGGVLA